MSASQDDGKTDGIHLIHYPDSIIYRQRDSGVTVKFFPESWAWRGFAGTSRACGW